MTVKFPLTGKTYRVDYGEMVVAHDYSVPRQISYTVLEGLVAGFSATVDVDITAIRDGVFALTFQDDVATVVMVEDVVDGTINTYMVLKADNALIHYQGTLTEC